MTVPPRAVSGIHSVVPPIKCLPGRADVGRMECFYHEGRQAVGSCRSCLKGLCRECAVEYDKGLACRLRCEEDVQDLIATIDQSVRYRALSTAYVRATPKVMMGIAMVSLFVGLFVSGWGLSLPQYDEIALLGIPFFALAAIAIRVSRRFPMPTPVGSAPDSPPA